MDSYHCSRCIKLFTFTLPLLCLLSLSSTAATFLPPPSSALLAADTLRTRGYTLFASVIVSFSSTANFTGTLLAPPDFAFSFATAKFLTNPRPSISLLQYHTLKPPFVLTWPDLSSHDDGDELRTFFNNNCLYLFKKSYGAEVSISSSPFRNPALAVKIRQPDLYVDEHLTVHGIDGVLDPTFARKCTVSDVVDPAAESGSILVNRVFLDRAMRVLRRKGYSVVAAAMSVRRSDLLTLTSVTVFAVSDENLFLKPQGFRYDFRHHVVPSRYCIAGLLASMSVGMEVGTLAPNMTLLVSSVDGAVNVNGVAVDVTEVYRSGWIVVLSIMTSLDDAVNSQGKSPFAAAVSDDLTPSPTPFSGVSAPANSPIIPSPSPLSGVSAPANSPRIPSPSPFPGVSTPANSPIIPSPIQFSGISAPGNSPRIPSPSPFSGGSAPANSPRIPSPAPSYYVEAVNDSPSPAPVNSDLTPSPEPDLDREIDDLSPSIVSTIGSPSPVPSGQNSDFSPSPASPTIESTTGSPSPIPSGQNSEISPSGAALSIVSTTGSPTPVPSGQNSEISPAPADTIDDDGVTHCDFNAIGIEGGDLLCPISTARKMRETEIFNGADVDESKPSDADSQVTDDLTRSDEVKIAENVNIADDLFFYI
ncbi:PREDICTED: protein PRRC2C-like [Erythranthe guttata]|uniref:protein PRRC2C-like n=1 Tax=Erythranthe guttata TaxID=4155 RepID=UPI00064DE594|nr:PREDICTED: protein PRRC2C-like [Erythranthe guttata]|eukprot:XP_012849721.1 PREDICTED: protein PRRC2C-like [Erythranthe guttata]